jgi:hypothetical protein
MRKDNVENILNKIIDLAYKKINTSLSVKVMDDKPILELVQELPDIYQTKRRFDVYIRTESNRDDVNNWFKNKLLEIIDKLNLKSEFEFRLFINTDIPQNFDRLVELCDKFKNELQNELSGYNSDEYYFKVRSVHPENPNWLNNTKMNLYTIIELHTIDPNDDDIVKAATATINRVIDRLYKNTEVKTEFSGYSRYIDVEEIDKSPYSDESINEEVKLRTFDVNVNTDELKWHRDREDRLVEVIDGDNWGLQFDNELPIKLVKGESYIIPEGLYHRVIKGDGELKVKISYL